MKRFNDFLKECLQDEEFKREYEALQPKFETIKNAPPQPQELLLPRIDKKSLRNYNYKIVYF